jgi:hypothetical protein
MIYSVTRSKGRAGDIQPFLLLELMPGISPRMIAAQVTSLKRGH